MNTEGKGKNFKKTCFFGTEIGEKKVGNYFEQDGLADGQTSKSLFKSSLDVGKKSPRPTSCPKLKS